jgi:hypothetical protein
MKKIYGQRWQFQIGNSLVFVDNAYDTSGWGKERLVINGETVQDSDGYHRSHQTYKEPWLSHHGEVQLIAKLKSTYFWVYCELWAEEEIIECQYYYETSWHGKNNSWPDNHEWIKKEKTPSRTINPKDMLSKALRSLKFTKKRKIS